MLTDAKVLSLPRTEEAQAENKRQGSVLLRLRAWFQWENLIVGGREVKGFVVTPTMALTLILAFLGAIGWAYKSNTEDSRATLKAITRMETLLDERTRNAERESGKFDAELKDERRLATLHRENETKKMDHMVEALKAKGIKVE